jgi:EpsI family protein
VKSYLRFAIAVALLLAAALFLDARSREEVVAPREPLTSFPRTLGTWTGTDVPIAQDAREVLGSGDFLLRVYQNAAVPQSYVDLFIAYFASQRTGDTIHSPKHCLPGAGWFPIESSRVTMSLPGKSPYPANRYIIAKGDDRQLVLYWYLAHNRAVASEYWAKFYLVADAIRMNRSDGALVRITTPLGSGEKMASAEKRMFALAAEATPHFDRYIPR